MRVCVCKYVVVCAHARSLHTHSTSVFLDKSILFITNETIQLLNYLPLSYPSVAGCHSELGSSVGGVTGERIYESKEKRFFFL